MDLGFGDERVAGILDTGAQRSLISTTCYERIQGQAPPLMQAPCWAHRMMGASGKVLTVRGELIS